jgi:hypothetical protein
MGEDWSVREQNIKIKFFDSIMILLERAENTEPKISSI